MLVYALRIFDFFNVWPCSLAILCDSNDTWRPKEKVFTNQGSRVIFEFTAVKLLDYKEQWAALEASMNPFATVVMAHLKAQETKSKAEERRVWKYELMRALYDKQYNESRIVNLFKFIDWFIVLPEKLENSFWNDLKTLEEEKKMTFVTSVERIGYKRGQKETLEKSKKQTEEMVLKMIERQISLDIISDVTGLSISKLERLANEKIQKIQSQQK
jgi:predicted DNA-binding ribbon-helix-helix protein